MRNKLPRALFVFFLLVTINLLSTSARAQRGLRVGHPSAPQPPGRFHALVIGNNAYVGMPRLTAGDDARAVEALLRESYGFETKLLLDATRRQIISALYSYRQTLEPDSSLLVYYAGHGFKDPEEQKAYWLPVDAARDSRLTGDAGKPDARARMTAADSSMRQPQSARDVFQPRTASGDAGRGRRP